ncbi:uncharacterized protein LOC114277206 [Camellia sinensis]|uniref:uncharacterized protein LOC114277206 n=1 Tax=Camellia sinensis TaxID=4442 RepID=UPI001036B238|nr:uncharacterized protein LOC114277206 [Camellia sinensis]
MIEDKPVRASDSATDIEVGVAFSTTLLLPNDLNHMAEVNEYENFALVAKDMKKELVHKTKEATGLLKSLNNTEAKMKSLLDQAKAAKQAQDQAEERAGTAEAVVEILKAEIKEAEVKITEAQAELRSALATKEAEIKAADEKAYVKRAADVRKEYKKQVRQACNKGYTLGWMATLKELAVVEDSPLRDEGRLVVSFPPALSQSEAKGKEGEAVDEAEEEDEEAEVEVDAEGSAVAKSLTLNEQVLDLTQDEEDEVQKTTSEAEVEISSKSLDDTLREIDAEVEADKSVTPPADEANLST